MINNITIKMNRKGDYRDVGHSQRKKDLRFLRTEKALIAAIKDLLAEKNFDDITINDICSRAAVSRTAFYQHFEDKYALVMAWIGTDIKPSSNLFADDTLEEYLDSLLDQEIAHHDQIWHLIHPNGNQELQWRISVMWSEGLTRYYEKKFQQGNRFDVPYEMMALYNCFGIINLICWNILNGYPFPKETMKAYIVRKIQQSNDFIHP